MTNLRSLDCLKTNQYIKKLLIVNCKMLSDTSGITKLQYLKEFKQI